KILIVDDEWLIRSELRDMLAQCPGIHVVGEAGTVEEAIRLIEDERPDAVFLDIQMPGQSGFDLLERTRNLFRIVFISAFSQYRDRAKQYKPVDYLMKPITKSQLARVVRKLQKEDA
ncbi:MAG TPA: response regulator, partial [bacterium]